MPMCDSCQDGRVTVTDTAIGENCTIPGERCVGTGTVPECDRLDEVSRAPRCLGFPQGGAAGVTRSRSLNQRVIATAQRGYFILAFMIGAPATTLKNTYKNCRLGRSDLTELFARATGHIPSTHVTVTTEHNNTRWTADSLSDLINSVTSASSYDSHVPWDNLQFRAEVPGGELEVLIDITPKWLHVRVEGTNDILVHGQQARIELFLRNRGASEAQEPHRQRTAVLTTVAVCAVSVLVVWGSLPQGPLVDPRVATIVVFGCSLAALTLTLPPLFFSRRAKLDVLQDIPRGSTWRRLTPMERATVIGLYVTALGVVGTVASGVVDVAGLFGE